MTKLAALLVIVVMAAASGPVKAVSVSRVQVKSSRERRALIGPIKGSPMGCGCGFSLPSKSTQQLPLILSSDIDEEIALMNIDGVDIELKLVGSADPKGKERIGSRRTRTYVSPGVKVSTVYVTTRMCKPNEEDCEATDYDATVTVTKGERKQTIKLKGACGC